MRALQAHRFNHLSQEFSGATDERQTLRVFVGARTFADEYQLGFGTSVAKDNFIACSVQLAASALAKICPNHWQSVAGYFAGGFEE